MIAVERLSAIAPDRRRRILERAGARVFEADVQEAAARALEAVRERGDAAVFEYTARFDGVTLDRQGLRVGPSEIDGAREQIPASLREALGAAIARARRYNERLLPQSWFEELEPGLAVGVKFTPLEAVGVYIPSGKGAFPSTAVTILTPAVVAGVPSVSVFVPPRPDGTVDPALLVACDLLGVRHVFRGNGVAGVAALAVGTETIPRVPAIVGPGNPLVAATQLLAQSLGVRMLALLGPTEAVVLADETADPVRLALDLLNEAEHGMDSAVLLVTDSESLAREVVRRIPAFLAQLPEPRRRYAEAALTEYGGIVVADAMDEAVAFVNAYAPEHLLIATADPQQTLEQIRNAGEILLGQSTPFSAGNYAIGVPAALPTSQAARVASGITVLSFLKASSVARLDDRGLASVRPVIEALGRYEGFPAHVLAVTAR